MVAAKILWMVLAAAIAPGAQRAAERPAVDRGALDRAAGLVREGKLAEAEQQLTAVLRSAPDEAAALNLLGTIRAQQNRLDDAEQYFTRAARADAAFAGPRMNLAYLYMLKGMPDRTIDLLREVVKIEPSNADAADKLARLLLSRGRVPEAVAFLEEIKHDFTGVAFYLLLGDAYVSTGDVDRAQENYLLALAAAPGNGQALLGLAQLAAHKGDAAAAAGYLARARISLGADADALARFGALALAVGLGDEAREALARAAEAKPNDAATLGMLGRAWLAKPDLPAAEAAFRKALAVAPADARVQLFLGYVLLKEKNLAEARALLEKSVAADGAAPEGLYYLGLIAQEEKDDAKAVELLERVTSKFPDYPHAHVALGVAYMGRKDYERAERELTRAVALDAGDQKAHFSLALLYARTKQTEKSREQMAIVDSLKAKSGKASDENDVVAPAAPPTTERRR